MSLIMLVCMPFLAFGLLKTSRIGYILTLLYLLVLILLNLYYLGKQPDPYYLYGAFTTIGGSLAIFVLLRREIRAPYMSGANRGFRLSKRFRSNYSALIDGQPVIVKNLSYRGLFCEHVNSDSFDAGSEVQIQLFKENPVYLTGQIVRQSQTGAGIQFTGRLSKAQKKRIKLEISKSKKAKKPDQKKNQSLKEAGI